MNNIKFSIILATLDRSGIIEKAINSILNQKYQNYEIIIIDQSEDDKTKNVIKNFNSYKIKYFKSDKKGLSIARNIGIKEAQGEYMCLMDDDAEYHEKFLENAAYNIEKQDLDLLCGTIKDKSSGEYFLENMNDMKNERLDTRNFLNICCSASLIVNLKLVREVNGFDERFGVGGIFYSAEETDLVFRILNRSKKARYIGELLVYHPVQRGDESSEKVYKYAIGMGAFIRKNIKLNLAILIIFFKALIKPMCGIIIYTLKNEQKKRKLSINRVKGRMKGIILYKEEYNGSI